MSGNSGNSTTIEGSRVIQQTRDKHGRCFALTESRKQYTRREGGVWQQTQVTNTEKSYANLRLVIAVRAQEGKGKEDHWSLFVSPEGQLGSVYQVKGQQCPYVSWRVGSNTYGVQVIL